MNRSLLLALALAACTQEPVTHGRVADPNTARVAIQSTLSDLNGCIVDLRDSEAPQAAFAFLGLDDGTAESQDWVDMLIDELSTSAGLDAIEDDRYYPFNSYAGTYSWSSASEHWLFDADADDAIVLHFPSTEDHSANGAEMAFSGYEDHGITIDDLVYGAPTRLFMDMVVDDAPLASFSGLVSYAATGFPVPTLGSLDLSLPPFDLVLEEERTTPLVFQASGSFTGPSACGVSFTAEAHLLSDDYEELEDEDVERLEATLTVGELSVVFSVDAESLFAIDEPTRAEYNAFATAEIFQGDTKLAELSVSDVDFNGDIEEVDVVYSNGEREAVEDLTDPFVNQLEDDLRPYFGDW